MVSQLNEDLFALVREMEQGHINIVKEGGYWLVLNMIICYVKSDEMKREAIKIVNKSDLINAKHLLKDIDKLACYFRSSDGNRFIGTYDIEYILDNWKTLLYGSLGDRYKEKKLCKIGFASIIYWKTSDEQICGQVEMIFEKENLSNQYYKYKNEEDKQDKREKQLNQQKEGKSNFIEKIEKKNPNLKIRREKLGIDMKEVMAAIKEMIKWRRRTQLEVEASFYNSYLTVLFLEKKREELNIPKTKVARFLGVHARTVRAWESGEQAPTKRNLKAYENFIQLQEGRK
jgi:DNA-binding transcriptional regulator YiaG